MTQLTTRKFETYMATVAADVERDQRLGKSPDASAALSSRLKTAAHWLQRLLDGPSRMPEEERKAIVLLVSGLIRNGEYDDAEALLTLSLGRCPSDARCLNLMGAVYEAKGDLRRACKYYGWSIAANSHYADAQQNMRRLFDLSAYGHTREPIALGDEHGDDRVAVLHTFPQKR